MKKTLCTVKVLPAICERFFYMKLIVFIIPTDLIMNSLLYFFVFSYKPKTRIRFSASWWFYSEKNFCVFVYSEPLSTSKLQSHAELNRLLNRNFLICYSCLCHSFMEWVNVLLNWNRHIINTIKADLKNTASAYTSKFTKKVDLAGLK